MPMLYCRALLENKLKVFLEKESNDSKNSTHALNSTNKPEPVLHPKVVEADTYFGVFIPSHLLTENEGKLISFIFKVNFLYEFYLINSNSINHVDFLFTRKDSFHFLRCFSS